CLNKIDALADDEKSKRLAALSKAAGRPARAISGVSGAGVPALMRDLMTMKVGPPAAEKIKTVAEDAPWTP
ncbi:MAG: hypothetical protein WD076_01855, partial [Parvularculaceae bacterium]